MTIDWVNFTPWTSLAGGLLLGLAAALFVLLNGRVLGITGIVAGLFRPQQGGMAVFEVVDRFTAKPASGSAPA